MFLVETIRVEVAKDGDEDQEFDGMNALLLASHFDPIIFARLVKTSTSKVFDVKSTCGQNPLHVAAKIPSNGTLTSLKQMVDGGCGNHHIFVYFFVVKSCDAYFHNSLSKNVTKIIIERGCVNCHTWLLEAFN